MLIFLQARETLKIKIISKQLTLQKYFCKNVAESPWVTNNKVSAKNPQIAT